MNEWMRINYLLRDYIDTSIECGGVVSFPNHQQSIYLKFSDNRKLTLFMQFPVQMSWEIKEFKSVLLTILDYIVHIITVTVFVIGPQWYNNWYLIQCQLSHYQLTGLLVFVKLFRICEIFWLNKNYTYLVSCIVH